MLVRVMWWGWGCVASCVAALLVWVRAELRLTEGSVLLAMGEPMGNDSVMSELSCACTIFSQPNNYWERRPEYVAFAPLYARRRRSSAVYPPLSAEFFIETLFAS